MEPDLDAPRMSARLRQVAVEAIAIVAPRRPGDVRSQSSREGKLIGPRLAEVVDYTWVPCHRAEGTERGPSTDHRPQS